MRFAVPGQRRDRRGAAYISCALIVGGRERWALLLGDDAGWGIGAAPSVTDYLTGAVFAFPDRINVDLAPRGPEWWLQRS